MKYFFRKRNLYFPRYDNSVHFGIFFIFLLPSVNKFFCFENLLYFNIGWSPLLRWVHQYWHSCLCNGLKCNMSITFTVVLSHLAKSSNAFCIIDCSLNRYLLWVPDKTGVPWLVSIFQPLLTEGFGPTWISIALPLASQMIFIAPPLAKHMNIHTSSHCYPCCFLDT